MKLLIRHRRPELGASPGVERIKHSIAISNVKGVTIQSWGGADTERVLRAPDDFASFCIIGFDLAEDGMGKDQPETDGGGIIKE